MFEILINYEQFIITKRHNDESICSKKAFFILFLLDYSFSFMLDNISKHNYFQVLILFRKIMFPDIKRYCPYYKKKIEIYIFLKNVVTLN